MTKDPLNRDGHFTIPATIRRNMTNPNPTLYTNLTIKPIREGAQIPNRKSIHLDQDNTILETHYQTEPRMNIYKPLQNRRK